MSLKASEQTTSSRVSEPKGIHFGSWADALDSLDTGVSIISPENKLEYFNSAYREIVGIPSSIVAGEDAKELYFYLAKRGDFGDGATEELANEKLSSLMDKSWTDGVQKMANGKTIKIRRSYSDDGYIITSITDITEIKKSATLASTVLNSTDQGIVITDAEGNIETVNQAYREMFKFPESNEEEPKTFLTLMFEAWQSGMFAGEFYGQEVATLTADQFRSRAIEFTALSLVKPVTIQTSLNHYLRFTSRELDDRRKLFTFTDISDGVEREIKLKQAQILAESADRSKSEFLANMSHEIRTPMNGVMGMAELLSNTELTAKQKSFTEIILTSSSALLTIINDILDFSKIEAGRLELVSKAFNLRDAVQDVAALIGANVAKKELELIVRIQPDLPEIVMGDVGRFRQVLTNIVGNAEKFTQTGYILINISGEQFEKNVQLECSVQDTGMGIPEDQISGIFEKFSQVDGSSTREHEGTGLGLAITSRLVSLMGGKIGCHSQPDHGSTFWFTTSFQKSIDQACNNNSNYPIQGMRLLAIDDNAINRSILLEQFSSWDLISDAAPDGKVGLEMMNQAAQDGHAYDAIVLDCHMPGMCGNEMARKIRNDPKIKNTPIVMLTSIDQDRSQHSNLDLDARLIKPVRANQLRESIETAIQKRQQGLKPLPHWLSAAVEVNNVSIDDKSSKVDIVIVDCEPVNQLLFGQIFDHLGISCKIVEDSAAALQTVKRLTPEIVLIDISDPDGNGIVICDAIRNADMGNGANTRDNPKVIGVSNPGHDTRLLAELQFSLDSYISKPISPESLVRKINKILPSFFEKERARFNNNAMGDR